MDNGTSEIELFVRFPGSARSLIERCVGSVASQWAEDILNAELNDSAGSDFTWIIGKQLSHLHTVLGRHLKPRNGSWLDLELDQNCPTMHSHSTIAHASLAVGTAALLIHILLVFSVNHGLVRLYGPCLLTSIGLTAAHNLLLFASSYIPTNLAVHLRFTGEAMHTPANAQTILCTMVDAVLHYLSISVHLSTLFALFEQYHISKGAYTKTSGSSGSCSSTSSNNPRIQSQFPFPVRSRSNRILDKPIQNSSYSSHSAGSRSARDAVKCRGKMDSYNVYTCSNNPRFRENFHAGCYQKSGVSRLCSRSEMRWSWFGPSLSMCLPSLPVGIGLWLTQYCGLQHGWNPAYGIFTCGSVGSCLGGMQLLLYLPLGFIFLGQITLIILLHIHTDQIPDVLLHSTQFPHLLYQEFEARFCMITKLAGSHVVVWTIAFISNHVCLVTMWQLYAILTGLQGLFVCVSFTFSRPFLEVVFKRNDPLSRLKLDNLVMQLPLGIVRGGKDLAYMPRNSSFTMPGLNLLGPPGSGGSTVPRKSGLTQGGGACRSSPTSCSPLTEAVHNVYGKQHLSVG